MPIEIVKSQCQVTAEIKDMLDALPFYVLLIDSQHQIIFANSAVTAHLGLDPVDVAGQYCPWVIHGSKGPVEECPLEDCVRQGDVAIEKEYYDATYSRWLSSAIYPTPLKTSTGNKIYFHTVRDINERKQAEAGLKESLQKLQSIMDGVIRTLTITVEKRDPYTAGHQLHVSRLARSIAARMGIPSDVAEGVRVAGLVHDIGKVAIPIEILSKPGKISDHEYHIIQTHPTVGHEILAEIDFPWPVAKIVLQHHERLDGSGYPYGIKGENILLEARILAVADVIEAITSHRPYRQALGLDTALAEITVNKGRLYDPEAVDACLALFSEGYKF